MRPPAVPIVFAALLVAPCANASGREPARLAPPCTVTSSVRATPTYPAQTATAPAVGQPPRIVQPGAPGEPTREITAERATDTSAIRHTPADVRFVQGMLAHHAQALEMTALVPTRSHDDALKRLAERIDVSQRDEMEMMRDWLTRRGESLPDPHAHHHADGHMPGMLSAAQMQALASADGRAFDRLFLEGMIQHHSGALTMVQELFATRGAGQEPDLFDFASEVEADQAMEIARMRAVLKELGR